VLPWQCGSDERSVDGVTNQFGRGEFLSRSARGGVAVITAGTALGALAGTAQADALPDADLAYLRMLTTTDLLGADFYKNAVAAQPYDGPAANELKVALANEGEHYTTLSTIIASAGQAPPTADDIDFVYPKRSFATTGAVTKLAVALEGLFLGAYLGAVAGVQSASLVPSLARIAANQAQHLTVFSQLLGRSGFRSAMPAPLTIDAVTEALAVYTG
jgi:Ferritin-like domain